MQPTIPLGHRLRVFAVYARLVLAYNALLSVFGAVALVLVGAAGLFDAVTAPVLGDGRAPTLPGPESVRVVVGVAGALVATGGHWLGVLVTMLVHHRELPLYRSGGWGPVELVFASWPVSVAVGLLGLLGARL